MNRDWGSRDADFIALTHEMRERLLKIANAAATHTAVPIAGSGSLAVEAILGTLIPPSGKLLVLSNGSYGERIYNIAVRLQRPVLIVRGAEHEPTNLSEVETALENDLSITHVAAVHCETTTGVLNPIQKIAEIVNRHGRCLIVDAMSSFGALPVDLTTTKITAIIASSNKCLEGVPGVGFSLVEANTIAMSAGQSPSFYMDMHLQWREFERSGQWRFTPPVQVVAALVQALRELEAEGGPSARGSRYNENMQTLLSGMKKMGFQTFLRGDVQAPIIATFLEPTERWFTFEKFYSGLAQRGFLIYPGKLATKPSFRIGCIGSITSVEILSFLTAVSETISDLMARLASANDVR
ncbi:2-aminoethylphosphonate--pyruvate transaminase [Rhizobium rhizogenes]|nr:2-aminoethylphosphonate--pyruvate transaminase [Rhizobium rhizogenes]